jgi:hypothetical protein
MSGGRVVGWTKARSAVPTKNAPATNKCPATAAPISKAGTFFFTLALAKKFLDLGADIHVEAEKAKESDKAF